MTKWIFGLAPTVVLLTATAIAAPAPVWVRSADQTEVRGRVTDVDPSGSQVVIEDQARLTIPPMAQVALADVRPGETVDVRYTENGDDKTVLSLRVVEHETQAP